MATEAWLQSKDDNKYAEAMLRCQHPAGYCSDDGYCHYDGSCFRSSYMAIKKAARAVQDASHEQPADVAAAMQRAVEWLNDEAEIEKKR